MAFTVGLAMTACTNSDNQKEADSTGTKTQAADAAKETADMDNSVGIYSYYGPSREGFVK